jgi:hypothetical protein
MANTLVSNPISVTVPWTFTKSNPLGNFQDNNSAVIKIDLENGELTDQVSEKFSYENTLAGTTSETLDLSGTLANSWGEIVSFARIKVILVAIKAGAAGAVLEIGGAGTNAWLGPFNTTTGVQRIRKSLTQTSVYLATALDATGWPVTAGTADLLKINNLDAAAITYRIVLLGCKT